MQNLTQPTLLLKPFAESGDKNTIPATNTDTSNPQRADLTNGFPQITSKLPSAGGLPPERKDFNALGYLTTTYDFFYQAGGTFTFNSTIASAIGGYPLNARLWYTDNNGASVILRSAKVNNSDNFITTPSYIGTSWVQETPALSWGNTWTGSNTFNSTVSLNGDLSVGTSAKQTIVGLCVPNYSARETISSPYTPTKNGIIIAHSGSGYSNAWISTNDDFVISMNQCQDSTWGQQTVWAIVKSGETYKFGSSGGSQYYFVPFVGA